ncbi:MAG: TIGR02281 family clan AA aspartic protease [Pseudolabrys sp.]|nr:TIGR02281 family clan AA aspartic protease [Pseudolabrys sp.]MDP2295030.1 TIGR02281 family clan AA aspartic protease [Pseudolabrys sp.]
MTRRLTWVFVIGFALSLAALIASHDQDAIATLLRHDLGALTIKGALALFAGGLVLVAFRDRLSKALEALLFWAVVVLLLVIGYSYRFELRDVADRVIAEVMPGHVASRGDSAEVVRGRGGDFALTARINGAKVAMVLDTGASSVVLTQEAAKAAGLPIEVLSYTVNVDTANGRTRAAAVTLDRIVIGGLTERAVPALVAQSGQLKSNLLGMSFLNRLEGWDVRGDRLRMRGAP